MFRDWISRRDLLKRSAAGAALLGAAGGVTSILPGQLRAAAQNEENESSDESLGHTSHGTMMTMGEVGPDAMGIDPFEYLTGFDYGEESTLDNGQTLREYEIVAVDREIEIAPGVFFPAWTYNGQVPGPTIRANEGDRIRIHFANGGSHPHTIHFHGIHSSFMDGVAGIGRGMVHPGESFTYEFDAFPFGCHLYHCHAIPLKRHIHKGLYGAFIVNPDPEKHGELARKRHPDYSESEEWYEFVMMMNSFDTTFDDENEVYAVNTIAHYHMRNPIVVQRDRPIRIYLINITEFDPINSFHIHANFFDYYDHGTTLEPTLRTVDTIMQCQAQRGIIEMTFKDFEPGPYMFHAHQSEFAELGWMSLFEVVE